VNSSNQKNLNTIYITCKDHTVSGEEFKLILDPEMHLLVTTPKPDLERLPSYYKSEDYISHTDSQNSITDKIYQSVKKRMLVKKLSWIDSHFPVQGKLLDIGAGTGEFLLSAKNNGWKVKGIEPNQNARTLAKQKGIKLVQDSSKFKAEKFDVITMWHVFEHVYDLKNQIIELEQLLKKDGLLIIAVPNFKSYDALYYKEHWAAFDVPRHLWHFSRKSFEKLFSGTSFSQFDEKPLLFDSFYVSLLSEKYKTKKSNFLKAFFIGLKSNLKAKKSLEYSSIAYFFRKSI
jgi:predicted SAM-dependent methyltransferase